MKPRTKDLCKQTFGALEVVEFVGYSNGKARWKCKCHDCGRQKVMLASNIVRNVACGCHVRDGRNRTHGMKKTAEYKCWSEMKRRCSGGNPNSIRYFDRGIFVCQGLAESFEWFYSILGKRPIGMTIERMTNDHVDVSKCSYTCGRCNHCVEAGLPLNVTWADRTQQARNRRSNHILTIRGSSKPIAAWSEVSGVDPALIRTRIEVLGWSPESAVFIQPHRHLQQNAMKKECVR